MKTAIISPHTDDAIWSLGSAIANGHLRDVTVISPFAGIPGDEAGMKKHTTLRAEHDRACTMLGVEYINGDFLDDVYLDRELNNLEGWLRKVTKKFDRIIIPMGIHHPDHVLIRNLYLDNGLQFHGVYEELPYRVLYPETRQYLVGRAMFGLGRELRTFKHTRAKQLAAAAYASQTIGGHIFAQIYVEERLWL